MRNLRIGVRLFVLIAVLTGMLLVVGLSSYFGLTQANNALTSVDGILKSQTIFDRLENILTDRLFGLVNDVNIGSVSWDQGAQRLAALKADYQTAWQEYTMIDPHATEQRHGAVKDEQHKDLHADQKGIMDEMMGQIEGVFTERDRGKLNLFVTNDLAALLEELRTGFLSPHRESMVKEVSDTIIGSVASSRNTRIIMTVVAVLGLLLAGLMGVTIYRSITEPVQDIANAVQRVTEGDFTARTSLTGEDELGVLGRGFDRLLDDRLTNLVQAEQENENLNDSIILLLQGVSQLSQRDLTVKVPVKEDVTGPMADALNLLTSETAKVLANVTQVSEDVAIASDKVKTQSDNVIAVANEERQEVERAAVDLAAAAQDMNHIADLARACNLTAEEAIETTRKALATVVNTVDGITSTRDTIRETEKRIKRLGERSQEISGVVSLINTIAERTHILALNASMHAASAGEAGRGFAVVADEVQRLAENAREATAQITTLVSSIQVETADTVNAMNQAITQVVEGSRMAEQAGDQMKKTQQTTSDLVASVQEIATRSQAQAQVSNALLDRAQQIQRSTVQTGQQLLEQNQYTTNLVGYAKELVDAVRVFKLPTAEA